MYIFFFFFFFKFLYLKTREYVQQMPQSKTADQPIAQGLVKITDIKAFSNLATKGKLNMKISLVRFIFCWVYVKAEKRAE